MSDPYRKKIPVGDDGLSDLYDVAEAYGIASNPQFNAWKKATMAGKRGPKGLIQDIDEAIKSLRRWKEMVVSKSDYGVRKDAPPREPYILTDGNGMPAVSETDPPKEKPLFPGPDGDK